MQLTLTADGSHTLQMDGCDEHYHSTEGAVEEARHVYLRPCFHAALNRFPQAVPLALFEMGFGTGLNALLTRIEAERLHRPVSYTAELSQSRERLPAVTLSDDLHVPDSCHDRVLQQLPMANAPLFCDRQTSLLLALQHHHGGSTGYFPALLDKLDARPFRSNASSTPS